MRRLCAALVVLAGCAASPPIGPVAAGDVPPATGCHQAEVAVQVLGSGGPFADDGRASSGYLVWVDGRARLLVDAGPGVLLRLGESGADPADLEGVLLSHLHVDHSADVAGLLKRMSFGERSAPLPVVGPTAGAGFPGLEAFLTALVGDEGAYPYLGYFGERAPFALAPREVDVAGPEAIEVLTTEHVRVRAIGVPHGPVPTLGFEVLVGARRVAFMGDQRADEARFVDMIRGADLLVAHMAIAPDTGGPAAQLHATPARLGALAVEANVGAVVLSHLMRRSLEDLDENLEAIRASYRRPLRVAVDGMCLPVLP